MDFIELIGWDVQVGLPWINVSPSSQSAIWADETKRHISVGSLLHAYEILMMSLRFAFLCHLEGWATKDDCAMVA